MNTSTIMYAMDGDDSTIYEEDIKVLGRGCVRPKREVGGGATLPGAPNRSSLLLSISSWMQGWNSDVATDLNDYVGEIEQSCRPFLQPTNQPPPSPTYGHLAPFHFSFTNDRPVLVVISPGRSESERRSTPDSSTLYPIHVYPYAPTP